MQRLFYALSPDRDEEQLKQIASIDEKPAFQALVHHFNFHVGELHYEDEALKSIQVKMAKWLSAFFKQENYLAEQRILKTFFNNLDEYKLKSNLSDFEKFKKFNAKLNEEQREFLYSLFLRDLLFQYYKKSHSLFEKLKQETYSFKTFYEHTTQALSVSLKPKFKRECFIRREDQAHLISTSLTFENLRDDFISHISEGNIDISTWSQLHKLILNWFKTLDSVTEKELAERGISEIVLRNNINTPDKLRNYIIRLRKDAKETLVSYFLADKFCAYLNESEHVDFFTYNEFSQDFLYRHMARALSIKLNYIDSHFNKKEYLPSITIDTSKLDENSNEAIKFYFHEIFQAKNVEKNAKDLFFTSSQFKISKQQKNADDSDFLPDYQLKLHSHIFPVFLNAVKDKLLPSVEEQLTVLFHIKKLLKSAIGDAKVLTLSDILANTTGKQKNQIEQIYNFWFPSLKIQKASANKVIPSIDFLIEQVNIIESSQNGRFMVGHYPKSVDDATKILNRLSEEGLIYNYKKFKTMCKTLSDKTLQDVLSKMLDHLLVIACNERVLDKKAPLFLEAIRLFGHINFIVANIEKSNIELRDKNNIIRQFVAEVETSVNNIKKSYVGFSWFRRLKRDITNWTRKTDRKIMIKNLPNLNKSEFLSDMMLLKKSINNSLDAKRMHKLVELKAKDKKVKTDDTELPKTTTSFLRRLFCRSTIKKSLLPVNESEKKNDLFGKTLRIIPKKIGAKTGAAYDMLGTDEIQRRFMIKQGGTLGETLSEYFSHLIYSEAMPESKVVHTAKIHLVIKSSDEESYRYKNPTQFGEHLYVASEYFDSYISMNACQVAGEKTRPILMGTRGRLGNPMYDKLIYLNNQCGLGLEDALHAAIRTCDYDLHSENVLLVFDINKISETNRTFAMQLIDDFKVLVESKPKKEILVEKLKSIQDLDVKVFFQKIDHGNSYKKYQDRCLRLDTSNIFLTGFPIDSSGTQATNHIAEWTSGKKGKDILLTDASCAILMKNTVENEFNIINNASKKFFEALHTASLDYSLDPAQALQAEFHLLKAFYKHAKDKEYIEPTGDLSHKIKDIQKNLVDFIIYNRFRLMDANNSYYLSLLSKIADKEMTTHQIRLQRSINEQQPQIRIELNERAPQTHVFQNATHQKLKMGMAGFQRW